MKRAPWFRLTAFALVAVLSGVVVVNTLRNPVTESTREYHAIFNNAEGLHPGSDVMIAGVRVGAVDEIELREGNAFVTFDVAQDQQLPGTGMAVVRYADMLGGRFLSLTSGRGGAPLDEGATIPLDRTRGPLDLTSLLNGFKPLFDAIDPQEVNELSARIVGVFDGESGTIAELLTEVVAVTSTISEHDQVIGEVVSNLDRVLGTMNRNRDEMRGLITGLDELTSEAARNRGQIAETLDSGSALAGSLSDALGEIGPGLSHDVRSIRQVTDSLVRNQEEMEGTVQNLAPFLHAINRAGGYGSWINVYICNLGVSVGGEPLSLGAGPHSEVCR